MILAVCIENTNLIISGYEPDQLFTAYLKTDLAITADECAISIDSALKLHGYRSSSIEGAIICSVVPPLDTVVKQAIMKLSDGNVYVIGPGVKTGLNIRTDHPAQLGSDRVCAAVAALHKYPAPIMVINMNTATTISVLDRDKCFIGGSIIPGVITAMKALSQDAAQLPKINLNKIPASIIGDNTLDAMRSGILYGNACMIDGLIERHRELLGDDLNVVATGQMVQPVIKLCKHTPIYDKNLLMDGLKLLYDKNNKR